MNKLKRLGIAAIGFMLAATPLRADTLRLAVQSAYLPAVPVLVRVEVMGTNGVVNRDLWDGEAVLSVDEPGVSLSTNRVILKNGLGSALVTISGGADFRLSASAAGLEATRAMRSVSATPATLVSGVLPPTAVTWSGVVRVTNDVTVPVGGTLTIEPGTLVLMSGVSSGTTAPDIFVNGSIRSLGTAEEPVAITCASGTQRWGQIRHTSAQPSVYRHTSITRAGRAAGEGHTGTGPVIRSSNSQIDFEHCNLTDHAEASGTPGKAMYASGSVVTMTDCLLARSRMGPEVAGTAIVCSNTWFMEMRGPDDADAIYIHTQSPGQVALLSGCVLAGGDDDGLDTYGSAVTVEDCIVRDWTNPAEDAKGISVFHGEVTVRRSTIVNCFMGISAKSSGPHSRVNVVNSTVSGISRGIAASWKSNATVGNILILATNTIVRSEDAVYTDFGATNFAIGFCNLSEPWPGAGNITADPLFAGSGTNYHLRLASPCVDAGDPTWALDADGTRGDMGAYAIAQDAMLPLGPVVIHEVMHSPEAVGNEAGELTFVELYNGSGGDVALYDQGFPTNTWRVGGGVGFVFPTNTVLPAYRTLVLVSFDPATNAAALGRFRAEYRVMEDVPIFGPWAGVLSGGTGTVGLYRPETALGDGIVVPYSVVDQVTYYGALPWPTNTTEGGNSLQRYVPAGYGNYSESWFGAKVTAGIANNGDSDGDGMPDEWEAANGLDRFELDGDLDADGDRLRNRDEYVAGTDPMDARSALALLSVTPGVERTEIRFEAVAGRSYGVEYSTNLSNGTWQILTNVPSQAVGGVMSVFDEGGTLMGRFYRASVNH